MSSLLSISRVINRVINTTVVRAAAAALLMVCANLAQAAGPGAQYYNEFLDKDLLYPDEEWQDYVTEIGERILAVSPHKGRTYTFAVTDVPVFDAYATPDAYIFVTRGLLAYIQSEDELAGIIGHEIGHVVGNHTKRRMRGARLGELLGYLTTFGSGSGSMFGLSQNVTGLMLTEYGREYELEADEFGAEYLVSAGYNPHGLLDSMHSMLSNEHFARTVKGQPSVYRGLSGTHPATEKRLHELVTQSQHLVPTEIPEPVRDFWKMIDGVTYGDEAATGVVKDGIYYHGSLRLTVKFPEGWDVRSTSQEVFGVPTNGPSGQISLRRSSTPDVEQTPLEYLTETLRRDDLENGEEIVVGPYIGYMADVKVVGDTKQARKIAVIYKDGGVYLFDAELIKDGDVEEFDRQFRETVFSMRAMTGADLRLVNNQKIKVIIAKPGDTFAKLARGVPLKNHAEETLRVINGLHPRGEPRAGDPIKIIQ